MFVSFQRRTITAVEMPPSSFFLTDPLLIYGGERVVAWWIFYSEPLPAARNLLILFKRVLNLALT
jgi:hypothetical protein